MVQDELPVHNDVKGAAEISGYPELDLTMGFGGDYELFFSVENSNYPDFRDAMESAYREIKLGERDVIIAGTMYTSDILTGDHYCDRYYTFCQKVRRSTNGVCLQGDQAW